MSQIRDLREKQEIVTTVAAGPMPLTVSKVKAAKRDAVARSLNRLVAPNGGSDVGQLQLVNGFRFCVHGGAPVRVIVERDVDGGVPAGRVVGRRSLALSSPTAVTV